VDLAMIGFGRMGGGMTERLARDGHRVVVVDPGVDEAAVGARGGQGPVALGEVVQSLAAPRLAWSMVPAGGPTESVVATLTAALEPGDVIVDGGNSWFRDSQRRAAAAAERGIGFLDVGVSGGIWGLTEGFALMAGGKAEHVALAQPVFDSLAPEGGFVHAGAAGAGHFTKMVHNGIEYGLMQAYAEGFEILEASEFGLDLAAVAESWRHGTVIRSWLLDLAASAFRGDPHLSSLRGFVEDSGEGRWTVAQAIETNVPAPVITIALLERLRSRQDVSFTAKVVAALRREFGGHAVRSS
jgi:6-phosphogluconate dehydrogenase